MSNNHNINTLVNILPVNLDVYKILWIDMYINLSITLVKYK